MVHRLASKRVGERCFPYGSRTPDGHGAQGYFVNRDFFEAVTDEQVAYWLGFITADGHVHCDFSSSQYWLKIVLQGSDSFHLEKFRRTLRADQEVKIRDDGKAHFVVVSKKICSDLRRLGILQRKSTREVLPTCVPESLLHHFFRGHIDGDGSWYVVAEKWHYAPGRKTGKRNVPAQSFCLSIVGGRNILRGFSRWATRKTGAHKRTIHPHGNTWMICFKGNTQCALLAKELYKNATVSLDRKREFVDKFLARERSNRKKPE